MTHRHQQQTLSLSVDRETDRQTDTLGAANRSSAEVKSCLRLETSDNGTSPQKSIMPYIWVSHLGLMYWAHTQTHTRIIPIHMHIFVQAWLDVHTRFISSFHISSPTYSRLDAPVPMCISTLQTDLTTTTLHSVDHPTFPPHPSTALFLPPQPVQTHSALCWKDSEAPCNFDAGGALKPCLIFWLPRQPICVSVFFAMCLRE